MTTVLDLQTTGVLSIRECICYTINGWRSLWCGENDRTDEAAANWLRTIWYGPWTGNDSGKWWNIWVIVVRRCVRADAMHETIWHQLASYSAPGVLSLNRQIYTINMHFVVHCIVATIQIWGVFYKGSHNFTTIVFQSYRSPLDGLHGYPTRSKGFSG